MSTTKKPSTPNGNASPRPVQVTTYIPPRLPLDATIFLSVLSYFASYALLRAGFFDATTLRGSTASAVAVQSALERHFPGGLDTFTWLVRTIFPPVLGIHVFEAWWLERSRLAVHGVRRGSGVWWLWVGSTFVEGFMAFKRFDLEVERVRGGKGGKGR